MSERGFDTYDTAKSYEDFAKSIGAETPLDMTFGSKCVRFFKRKGKTEEEAKTLCYGVAQKKYKELKDKEELENDDTEDMQEENKFYQTPRSQEKRIISKNSRKGLSKTGRKKRSDAGRRKEGEYKLNTDRASSHQDCIKRQIYWGYSEPDAKNICNKITFGIQDRIKNGVSGKIPSFRKDIDTLDDAKLDDYKEYMSKRIETINNKEEITPREQKELTLINKEKEMVDIIDKMRELQKQQKAIENDTPEYDELQDELDVLEYEYDEKKKEHRILKYGQQESFTGFLDDLFDETEFLEEKKKKKKKKKSKKKSRTPAYRGGFGGYYRDNDSDGGDGGGDGGGGGE